jgi:molybdate transport system permease protein
MVIQNGDYATAGVWVVIMLVIAFVIVLAMNLVGSRGRNTEKRW